MCHDELMRNRPQPIKPSAKCMQLTTCPACILPGAKPPAEGLRQPGAPAQPPEEALLHPDTAPGRRTGGEGQRPPGDALPQDSSRRPAQHPEPCPCSPCPCQPCPCPTGSQDEKIPSWQGPTGITECNSWHRTGVPKILD